ncbi:hypothetical protein HK096_003431 [Nowakowskiella sp. JEL0078]|nr:hypothetical protein HK096_003431 [Nowakowskiella sp. JEL0078]
MSNNSSPSKPSPLYQMQLDLDHQQQILGLQMQLDQLQQQQINSELIESPQSKIFSELAARAARSRSFSRDHAPQNFNNLTLQSIQTQQQLLQSSILQSQYSPLINPQTQNIRRARAETFSSFPSKIVDEVSREGSPRIRSGSLTMPSASISNAFGQSIFTSSWEPTTESSQNTESLSTFSNRSINDLPDDTSSIARTFDLLGLDDPETNLQFGSSPHSTQIFTPLGFRERSHSNSSNSSPVSEIAARLGPQNNAAAASVAAALRARSYTIPVGENLHQNLSISIPPNLRPRATSIAYLESERDVGKMLISAPTRERSGSTSSQNAPLGSANIVGYERSKLSMVEEPSLGGSPMSDKEFRNGMQFNSDYAPSALNSASNFPSLTHMSPFPDVAIPNLAYSLLAHQTPSRSLWIGNIDPALSAADLLTQFTPFGSIESLRILSDKECAFVNYLRVEEAVVARDTMQGARIGNCIVKIGFGRPESNDVIGMQPTKRIGNIPPTTDPIELENIFSQFGQVESARVLTHKNCGFVNFFTVEDAIIARKAMNGAEITGSIVKIGFAKVPDLAATTALTPPPDTIGMSKEASYSSQMAQFTQQQAAFHQSQLGFLSPQRNAALLDALGPPISPLPFVSREDVDDLEYLEDQYFATVSMLPEPNPNRQVDQSRAREIRKRLEGHVSGKEVEAFFLEVLDDVVDLCTDYIGNVVVQKLMEKCNDAQRQCLIDRIAPHMSSIGIHKNGTWAAQKIIDCARTPGQIQSIVTALQPYTPPLLLDQFGNYVVQCCLRLGTQRNQFVFDALYAKCWEIGQGRFGARAMRACLESPYTTKRQQKHVSIAIVQNAVALAMNPNGTILINWLVDSSTLPGRFRVLAPKLTSQIVVLCTHKLGSAHVEPDAREVILKEIFFSDDNTLGEILSDVFQGVPLVHKILVYASPDEKVKLGDRVRENIGRLSDTVMESHGNKRLLEELAVIPSATVLGNIGFGGEIGYYGASALVVE